MSLNHGCSTSSQLIATVEVGDVALISQISQEWRSLCDEGPCQQPFYQPEWVQAYFESFCPQKKLTLISVRKAGKLRAVLPLINEEVVFCGLVVRKLRSASNVHSCRFDIVHGFEDAALCSKAIWQAIGTIENWDVLEVRDVLEGAAFNLLMSFAASEGYRIGRWHSMDSPYIRLPLDATQLEASLNPQHHTYRGRIRKKMRKFRQLGPLVFQETMRAEPELLNSFYELEANGWKGRECTAIACDYATKSFYDRLAYAAADRGYLRFQTLLSNGSLAAMNFGFCMGGRYYLPKFTFNERFSEYSPGQVIIYEMLHELSRQRIEQFEFLGPNSYWKEKWAFEFKPHLHCYVFQRNALGNFLFRLKFGLFDRLRTVKRFVTSRINRAARL